MGSFCVFFTYHNDQVDQDCVLVFIRSDRKFNSYTKVCFHHVVGVCTRVQRPVISRAGRTIRIFWAIRSSALIYFQSYYLARYDTGDYQSNFSSTICSHNLHKISAFFGSVGNGVESYTTKSLKYAPETSSKPPR